jgi:hypothetical protein
MAWTQFSFPTGYYYDVLRGLEYLRSARVRPDARMAEAIDLVLPKRDAEGRWPLENVHPERVVRAIGRRGQHASRRSQRISTPPLIMTPPRGF